MMMSLPFKYNFYQNSIAFEKRKEKTTPFGVNIMRDQVLYWAAQE